MHILRSTCLLFLWLSFTVAAPPLTCPNLGVLKATPDRPDNVSLLLYPNETMDDYTRVPIGDAVTLLDNIDWSYPTVLYISGWMESPDSTSVKTVIGAYLKRKDHNVIVVDWKEFAAESYESAASSAAVVGRAIAIALNTLVAVGLDSTSLHVVSHSLGSSVAGFVGGNVNFTLPRITGLDPAGAGFPILVQGLTSSNAQFVDVMHTDAGIYGTLSKDSSVNFYMNGGSRPQPGCSLISLPSTEADLCSHRRSWSYYAESLLKVDAFLGIKCDSYISFVFGSCNRNERVVVGYATPSTTRGNFHLQTNSKSPFGKGKNGVTYVSRSII